MNFTKENVIKEIKNAKKMAFESCVVSDIVIGYLEGLEIAVLLMENDVAEDKLTPEEIEFWNDKE